MKLPKPLYPAQKCPDCGERSNINFFDSGYYWLANTWWTCPYCKGSFTTTVLQEANGEREKETV